MPKVWAWISFIIFGFIIALLGTSLFKQESPAQVLRSWFTRSVEEGDLSTYDKEDLVKIIETQRKRIDSLDQQLDRYIRHFGIRSALIEVEGETLNLRSEPTITSDIIDKIPNNTIIGIIRCQEETVFLDGADGSWCRIKYAGQEGWVWGNYLKEIDF